MRFAIAALATALSFAAPPSYAASYAADEIAVAAPEAVGVSPQGLSRIKQHFEGYVSSGRLLGLTTAVARGGKLVHFETYGARTVDRANPTEKDTIYRIYSMTKPVTSAALMMLWEEGKFKLDDPLADYIPAFADTKVFAGMNEDGSMKLVDQARPITVKDLMMHTAGMTYGVFSDTPVDALYREANPFDGGGDLEDFVNVLADLPLLFQPGTRWHYSVSVDVQGRLIEVLSGMTLEDFFRTRIFEPLGMDDTAFYVPADKLDRFSDMVTFHPETKEMIQYNGPFEMEYTTPGGPSMKSGGGGLVSTTEDYARFALMLAGGGALNGTRILQPETVALMTQNHLPQAVIANSAPAVTGEWGFGLGFAVILDPSKSDSPASVGEYNWGGAANTVFWVDPQEDVVALLMTNVLVPTNTFPLRADMRRLVYGALEDAR